MRQDLAFVRLHQQHPLFAYTGAVQFRVLSEIKVFIVE
jgi:hypothetical protein